ncbi:DUF4368 domain-containing protein [Bacillus sp. BRMEA1]|uniref:DUF4368 domain-containing protein n=1 Tax=Neobacillus endophyticus TaxID=2738405 RepID=UPI00156470BF|nr:DUF4368 domain-containing protein [Neobacillus endophyticus]NRD78135.1 DUF4368 domain-containing protein [Neobacillus endophyticus]
MVPKLNRSRKSHTWFLLLLLKSYPRNIRRAKRAETYYLIPKADLSQKLLTKNNNKQLDKLKREITRIKKFETLTPQLLHRLIDRIEIKADGTARIFFRFSLPSAII